MKTYFLALNKEKFSKQNRVWTSSTIDLYSNEYYTNYSTYRSEYGINTIGDYTFVGTSLISGATPTVSGASIVTNYGEIKLEENTRRISNI